MNPQVPTPNAQRSSTTKATKRSKGTKNLSWLSIFFAALSASACCAAFAVPAGAQTPEKITEIRVHGNHTTPDADVLKLSGLTPGADASETVLKEAERKLRATGRFEGVEMRRRYLSIDDPSRILVMIVVDEHPAVSAADLTPGPLKKLRAAQMWMPVLKHEDGYGFTYGARLAFKDTLGDRSRLSVPMTWGGERRIGLDAERSFDGPISVVRGGVSLSRRVNPFFAVPDRRTEARAEADRLFASWLRAGVDARVANVEFGPDYEARHSAAGVHAVLDTRIDPSFPRNAVHTRVGWERLFFGDSAGRWTTDARGYVGVGGSLVLALRAQMINADAGLPLAEQSLLGGSGSVRGYRSGHRAGDNLFATSAELRLPLNSPLTFGRVGVKAFVDAGTVWNSGTRFQDQAFDRGIGGGVYLGGGPFIIDLDVAKPRDGSPRAHFGMGVTF
jgi:outer membrane protein assembly factor BamA